MALSAIKNLGQFLKEVKLELTKIAWPSFNEFIGSTVIVLIVITLFSIYLGFIDFCFAWFARQIFIS
jgi:preprotein translocase subunit SecE